jgi:hypothetical protein
MEDRVEKDGPTAESAHLRHAPHLRDPVSRSREQLGREVAQRADDTRLDQIDLLEEVALAGIDLGRLRIAVARRPALEYVGDEALLPRESDLREQLVEEAASAADERLALTILVEAGSLAHEHQVGVGVPGPEDDLRARCGERALLAVLELLPKGHQPIATSLRLSSDHVRARVQVHEG